MPYKKSPSSLQDLCLTKATINFDQIKHRLTNTHLPDIFITNIYLRRSDRFGLTERLLPSTIFIRSRTRTLRDLHKFDLPIGPLLARISDVCENLVDLNLDQIQNYNMYGLKFAALNKLLQRSAKLERLSLVKRLECTDRVVAAIGEHCPLLYYLNLADCQNVSDDSVRSLCNTKLQYLNIMFTGVTAEGCLAILNQLPLLKDFRHSRWGELFRLLEQQIISNEPLRTYTLEECCHYDYPYDVQTIATVTATFPNLCKLSIRDILDVGSILNHAQDKLLRITSLTLYLGRHVKIRLIDHCCPLLESLELLGCHFSNETYDTVFLRHSAEHIPYKNLLRLHVYFTLEIPVTDKLLLLCQNLESFKISWCNEFSDQLVSKHVRLGTFKNLKFLSLVFCHLITLSSIKELLVMHGPLNALNCHRCSNIDDSAFVEIDSDVKSKNLDIQITNEYIM